MSILDQIARSLADNTVGPDAVRWTPDGPELPKPRTLAPELRRSMWYDKQGQPIDSERANMLLGDRSYSRVALTRIRSKANPEVDLRVSTVWLAVDYNFLGGPPILFETMVFGPGSGEPQWRWCTEQQAIAGHAQVVAEIAAGVPRVRIGELEGWGGPSFLDARYRQRQINRRRRRK